MAAAKTSKAKSGRTFWMATRRAIGFLIAAAGTAGAIGLAIAYNVAAMAGRGELACCGGVALVLGAALFVHGALHMPNRAIRPILGVAAALLIFTSWTNARHNMSAINAAQADMMNASVEAAEKLKNKRASLETRRAEQVKIAGEAKPATIENQIAAEKMAAGRAWSNDCTAVKRSSRDQCTRTTAKILGMQAQIEAANERDKLTHEIEALDSKDAGIAPTAAAAVGDAQNEGIFAASVELIAALAPTLLFSMLVHGGSPSVPVPASKPSAKPAAKREDEDKAPLDLASEFADECLDPCPGVTVSNPDMWAAWTKFCGKRNADPGTKKSLQAKLKNYAAYENNNNRPRYAGVRLRAATGLRLAVSN